MEMLEYAEKAGAENIKFHIECAEAIGKEANTTLTILLAASGTALGYTVKLFELGNHPYLVGGMVLMTAYLFVLTYYLISMVMGIEAIEAPTNEPANLLHPDHPLESVREIELRNLQARIKGNIRRNDKKAGRLNGLRLAVIFVPVLFALGMGFGVILGG